MGFQVMATSDSPLNVPNVTLAVARQVGGNPSGTTPFFEDDFASGDLSKTANGFSWGSAGVGVNADRAFSGANSASLIYGPDAAGEDSSRELRFSMAEPVSEVWLEFQWYVPSNFYHRNDTGPDNNKLAQLSYNNSEFQALTVEFDAPSGGTSQLKRAMSASSAVGGGTNWPSSDDEGNAYVPNFIGPGASYFVKTGQWNQIRIHFRLSSDGVENGVYEIWANGALVKRFFWPFWSSTYGGFVNGGYLMGWADSGYTDATEFRIDSVKFYLTDPGWV